MRESIVLHGKSKDRVDINGSIVVMILNGSVPPSESFGG